MSLTIVDRAKNLAHLRTTLEKVISTLGAVGADGYQDLYVFVSGVSGGRPLGDLSVERDRFWITTGRIADAAPEDGRLALPEFLDDTNGRAILIAGLLYVMWTWDWDPKQVARYLGCGPRLLESWIERTRRDEVPELPEAVMARIRRLAIVEHMRVLAGVPDEGAAAWLREPRDALAGRAALAVLALDGDPGFRRVLTWLLDHVAATSVTVH